MSQSSAADRPANHLLRALTADDFALLKDHLEPVPLTLRQTIEEPHKPIQHVYFVEDGLMSVVASAGGEDKIEVGLIGWEGMSGIPLIMGDDRSPYHTFIQIAGRAQRMKADAFQRAIEKKPVAAALFAAFRASVHVPDRANRPGAWPRHD
jgi:CRP-like cAMP-binding protein